MGQIISVTQKNAISLDMSQYFSTEFHFRDIVLALQNANLEILVHACGLRHAMLDVGAQ